MSDLTWLKSSYSGQEVNCVELAWRKSSYSGGGSDEATSNCVELAASAVRDSKNPSGGALNLDITALVAAVKAGRIAG
ncbi:MAG TPA: DUF397 domain-containing protein [Pseudonocardiaceae bacterium]|jgi:hypothetical protein